MLAFKHNAGGGCGAPGTVASNSETSVQYHCTPLEDLLVSVVYLAFVVQHGWLVELAAWLAALLVVVVVDGLYMMG